MCKGPVDLAVASAAEAAAPVSEAAAPVYEAAGAAAGAGPPAARAAASAAPSAVATLPGYTAQWFDSVIVGEGQNDNGEGCWQVHFKGWSAKYDALIVRINPGQLSQGTPEGTQQRFDALMNKYIADGKLVWSSPKIQTQMGAKDALVKIGKLNCGMEDTYAYYSADELITGFKKTCAFQPRVIKQNRGSSGEGIWIIKLKDRDYCKHFGDAPPEHLAHVDTHKCGGVTPAPHTPMVSAPLEPPRGVSEQSRKALGKWGELRAYSIVHRSLPGSDVPLASALVLICFDGLPDALLTPTLAVLYGQAVFIVLPSALLAPLDAGRPFPVS